MKKIKLIYNPVAGNKTFPNYLDSFIEKFQKSNFKISIYRSVPDEDLDKGLDNLDDNYRYIIVAGGDGTLNKVVNAMMIRNINLPLGIIPAGTVNDFASHLNMPGNFRDCFDVILEENLQKVDIGQVNNRFFINVCLGGVLSDVSHTTGTGVKNKLGKLAYYINGLKEITKIQPLPLKITTSQTTITERLYMFMILNSKRAGGFKNLAQKAKINDGVFDFIGVKTGQFYKIPSLLLNFFQGGLSTNKNIIYLQDNYFKIKQLMDNSYSTDIDGEKGPKLPLEIKIHTGALDIFIN